MRGGRPEGKGEERRGEEEREEEGRGGREYGTRVQIDNQNQQESNNTRLPESVNNKVVAQSARDSPSAPRPKRPSNSSNNKRSRR